MRARVIRKIYNFGLVIKTNDEDGKGLSRLHAAAGPGRMTHRID